MKTKCQPLKGKNATKIVSISIVRIIMMALFIIAVTGCSKDDDDPSTTIEAKSQSFTLNGINNCNTSSGSGSTLVFTIPYTTSTSLTIQQLNIKTSVSDGGTKDGVNTQFTDNNGSITWATCFRYGSQSWVDYEVRLQSTDGTISNPITTRVNKPSGAN